MHIPPSTRGSSRSSAFTWPLSLLYTSVSFLLLGTPAFGIRNHSSPVWSHPTVIPSPKTPFPSKTVFLGDVDLGGHQSVLWGALFRKPWMRKGFPELRVFPLRSPTPGPQLSSCRDLGEILRGQSGPGKPAFLAPPQTAHLLPTKCPGSQFKEASLTTVEFLSSAAGGELSVCINDHWTC